MRLKHAAILLVMVLISAAGASADGVPGDPQARLGGGSGGSAFPISPNGSSVIVLTSPVFTLSTNSNGGGAFTFQNGSDVAFNQLMFTAVIVVPQQLQLFCGTLSGFTELFANCQFIITNLGNGKERITVAFSGLSEPGEPPLPGIPVGGTFTLSLNNGGGTSTNGKGGWGANNTVTGVGSPSVVPEPGTIALTATGLGALLAKRRKRRQAI